MKFKVVKRCHEDLGPIHGLLKSFLPFAKKRMGFNKPPTIFFQSDDANAKKLLGKTAHYDPTTLSVTVYVTGRHPKDVLRSLSHELVHHGQNCRGEFGRTSDTSPGYAQKDNHLRGMEKEAYKVGNLCFRDWEDGVKMNKIQISMPLKESLLREEEPEEELSQEQEPGLTVLSRGMGMGGTRDEKVARMQALLVQAMGLNILPKHGIDGRYGPETEQAVKQFQIKHGLQETGAVDTLTLKKLEELGDVAKAEDLAGAAVQKRAQTTVFRGKLGKLEKRKDSVSPSRLFQDLKRLGVEAELAKAAVVNARGESWATMRGDIKIGSVGDGGCSLGLWQFNICAGLGIDMMDTLGISIEKDGYQKVYDTITDYDTQIKFMSNHITKINPPGSDITTAEDLTKWFVYYVERPENKPKATRLRLGFLNKYEKKGIFGETALSESLGNWKNTELNRLLMEKFNLGDKK